MVNIYVVTTYMVKFGNGALVGRATTLFWQFLEDFQGNVLWSYSVNAKLLLY